MSLNKENKKPHSAEYFGEPRDFWWNSDFLELVARRFALGRVKHVLDVGCGVGHWGQLFASIFSDETQVVGVDLEVAWLTKAAERARCSGLGSRYQYQIGDANELPFEDNSFDFVTCQTVLIHLRDPKRALSEMLRVLRPGGTLLVAEPNNFANRAIISNLTERLSVDEVMARLRFDLIVERGKKKLGLGFNSIGDLIPGYLAELGGRTIRVYLSDKATPFFPPYSTTEQQVNIEQMKHWISRGFIGWDRDEVFNYFMEGGGKKNEFDYYFNLILKDNEQFLDQINNETYHSGGGAVTYLIGAQK